MRSLDSVDFKALKQSFRKGLAPFIHKSSVVFLSGGWDSKMILAEAINHIPNIIAVNFGKEGIDNVEYAKRFAESINASYIFEEITLDMILENAKKHLLREVPLTL